MIHKHARSVRLPAQHSLLAGIDERQRGAAQRTGCGVKVDVVRHRVGRRD